MHWLLEQPLLISFLVICMLTVCISLAGLFYVRNRFPHEKLKDNHDTASVIFNAYGLLYAVVVAFVVFITWSSYDKATMEVEMEANALMNLFYLTDAYPDSIKKDLQAKILDYTKEVTDNEWNMNAEGEVSTAAAEKVKDLWNRILSVNTGGIKIEENISSAALETMKSVTESRRLRSFAVKQTVPSIVWAVLLLGGILFIGCTYFFSMKNAAPQYLITACFTILITLVLYLIYVLDHAFTGTSAINNEPLKFIINVMKQQIN